MTKQKKLDAAVDAYGVSRSSVPCFGCELTQVAVYFHLARYSFSASSVVGISLHREEPQEVGALPAVDFSPCVSREAMMVHRVV